MTAGQLLARRRALHRYRAVAAANHTLYAAARDLRREAQVYLNAGRPDLAAPYLEEAETFESAAQPPPSL